MRCPACQRRIGGAGCAEHGYTPTPASSAETAGPPAELPDLVHRGPLATGGSARVFAALTADGRDVVVKWGRWRDAELVRRFRREAELIERCHGVVPRLHAAGVIDGWPYLVLERIGGPTLAEQMATGLESPRDRLACVGAIALALAQIHARGVIHADLKPENVFVLGHERPLARLIDLGIARQLDEPSTDVGATTVHYAAPEQLRGDAFGPSADVYALGVIAFELITGRPPFVGDRATIELQHQVYRAPLAALAGAGDEVIDVLGACLDKRPARRPRALEVASRLASAPVLARPPTCTTPVSARRTESGPAILLWIAGGDPVAGAELVAASGGRVIRSRPDGSLAAYTWCDSPCGIETALDASRALTSAGLATALHQATVKVRRSAGRVTVYGEAVEEPRRWLPEAPWTGGLVSCELAARVVGAAVRSTDTPPGWARLAKALPVAPATEMPRLETPIAHGALIAEIAELAGAALREGRPRLLTIVGEARMGKTAVAEELERRLAGLGAPIITAVGRRDTAASLIDGLRSAAERGVVLLLDDAHQAADTVLDAIESAAAWERGRLVAIVITAPALFVGRPTWGRRGRSEAFTLQPLAADDAVEVARRLLAPALRIPTTLLHELVAVTAGIPGQLVAAIREIHRRGLVRRLPDSEDWYIAADQLAFGPTRAGGDWLVDHELARLPPALVEFLGTCAALGAEPTVAELDAVQASSEAAASIDASGGLTWLARAGLIVTDNERWTVGDPRLGEAAYARLDAGTRRRIHAAALAWWRGREEDDPILRTRRVAYHGERCGEGTLAATAYIELARRANLDRRHLEAERLASHALAAISDHVPTRWLETGKLRCEALLERGRARRPLTLFEAARLDFREARALAEHADARALVIETLVADGAACDFTDHLAESAELVERADAIAATTELTPLTRARLNNWLGVVRARQNRLVEAQRLLEDSIAIASEIGDNESAVGSMLMLGGVYRRQGRLDGGRAILDRAIERCRATGDIFHLTIGYYNRINVWRKLGELAQAESDCRTAVDIAERHGYGQIEIWGWHNLASIRFECGRPHDALVAARQAYHVARRRFGLHPPLVATLQLAALEAGAGDHGAAARHLAEIDDRDAAASPSTALMAAAVAAAIEGASTWDALVARAATDGDDDDRAMIAWLRASSTTRAARAA